MKHIYLSVITVTLVLSGTLVASATNGDYAEIRSLLGKLLQGDTAHEDKAVDTVKKEVSQEKEASDKTVQVQADDKRAVEKLVEDKSETQEQPVEKEESLRELLQEFLKKDVVSETKTAEKKELGVAEEKEEKVSEKKTEEKKTLEATEQKEDSKLSELKEEEKKALEDQKKENDAAVNVNVVAVETEKRNKDQKEEQDATSDTLMTSLRALLQKYKTKEKSADKKETLEKKEVKEQSAEKTVEERAQDHPLVGGEDPSDIEQSEKAVEKKEAKDKPAESTVEVKVHEERSQASTESKKNLQNSPEKKYSVLRGLLEKYIDMKAKRVESPIEKSEDLVAKDTLANDLSSTDIRELRNLVEQMFGVHQESSGQEKSEDTHSSKIRQLRTLLREYLHLDSKDDQAEKDLRELETIRDKKSRELKDYEAKLRHLRELAKVYRANVQEQEKRESHNTNIGDILSRLSKEDKLRMIRQLILNKKSMEEQKTLEDTHVKTEEKKTLLDEMHSLNINQKRHLVDLLRTLKDQQAKEDTQSKEKKALENLAASKVQDTQKLQAEQKREENTVDKQEKETATVEKKSLAVGAAKEKREYAKLRALIESFAS